MRSVVRRLSIVACFFLTLYVVFPWIGYHIIAPQGWHNSTVHGNVIGIEYAVSHDEPGIMLACGSIMEHPFPFSFSWVPRCWRSYNGGENWTAIQAPPFADKSFGAFHLIVPRADAGIFYAVGSNKSFKHISPQSVLVTHDVGATWHDVTQLPGDLESELNLENALATGIYRDGKLYTLLVPISHQEGASPQDFAVSSDDGKTWTRAERAPSSAEKAGWQVTSFAADYRSPFSWYRTLEDKGSGLMLEHSSDDGQSWDTVQQIIGRRLSPSHIVGIMSLATTPVQPEILCASGFGTWLAASSDGGNTWRGGPSQVDFSNANGYTPSGVQIGNDGSCYRAFTYQNTPGGITYLSSDEGGPWYNTILRLDPHGQRSTTVPLSNDFTLSPAPVGATDAPGWWYVPAGHGLPARIVIVANPNGMSLASFFEWTQETNNDLLLWSPMS